jgi:predicted nucleic acid-binding protein
MKIISDASPLINLAWIGKIEILSKLYGEICISEAVWQEVVVQGSGQPGSEEVKASQWIKRQEVGNKTLVQSLMLELDAGEAEAIALALETNADLLLMDERLGRETAMFMGLRVVGLVGVLIEAKRKGIITEIKTSLDQLRKAGFYLHPTLYMRILMDQGEST